MPRKESASWTGFYIDGNLICGPRAGYLPVPPPPPEPEPTAEEIAAAREKAERAAKRKRAREAWRDELNGGPRRARHARGTAPPIITLTAAAATTSARVAATVKTTWLDRALAAIRARGTGTPASEGTSNVPAKGVSDTKTPVPTTAAAEAAAPPQAQTPVLRQAGVPVPRSDGAPDAVPSSAGKLARGFVESSHSLPQLNDKVAERPAVNADATSSPTAAPAPSLSSTATLGPANSKFAPREAPLPTETAVSAPRPDPELAFVPEAIMPTPEPLRATPTKPAHYYILGNRIFLSAQPLGPRGRELRDAAPPPDSRPTDFTIRCGQICGPGAKGFFIRARHIYGPKGRRVPWLETAA